jgi:hypothetical protein
MMDNRTMTEFFAAGKPVSLQDVFNHDHSIQAYIKLCSFAERRSID